MIRTTSRMATSAALLLTALTAACSDQGVTNPVASPAASPLEFASPAYASASMPLSFRMNGDTTVIVFVLGTNKQRTTQYIGNNSTIEFPMGAASVCNIAKSSYGVGTWDSPCAASTSAVTITAKSWINAKGKVSSEFSPAMRFVPSSSNNVTLTLLDFDGTGKRIDYCTKGSCVDEAITDSALASVKSTSVATMFSKANPLVKRRIKHFSGYSVTAD